MQHFVRLIEFAFANRTRAIISGIVLLVLGVMVLFFPQVIIDAIGRAIQVVLGGIIKGVGPFLGILMLFGLLWAALKKTGGLGHQKK